jgi:signal transduction histidine kinase
LSIVKAIVERHRGTVMVASAPGAGTTFAIELPVSASGAVGEVDGAGQASLGYPAASANL